jgi:DNA replication protein DnaC
MRTNERKHDSMSDATDDCRLGNVLAGLRFTVLTPEEEQRRKRAIADEEERARRALIAQLTDQLSRDLGPRYSPERTRFESYEVYDEAQRPVLARIRHLATTVGDWIKTKPLLIIGTAGTGKDRLAAALLYVAAREQLVHGRWTNCQQWLAYKAQRKKADAAGFVRYGKIERADVLVLSDPTPPVGELPDWHVTELYQLVDERYRFGKVTWVTANVDGLEGLEYGVSTPVFDRLREGSEVVQCFWPSYRERQR